MSEDWSSNLDSNEFEYPPRIIESGRSTNYIDLPEVLQLGIQLEYLRNIVDSQEGSLPSKKHVHTLLMDIESLLSNQDGIYNVKKLIVNQEINIGEPETPEEQINDEQAEELKKQVTSWIHLLSRDLGNETRIPVVSSGVLDIDTLTNNPSELFNQEFGIG